MYLHSDFSKFLYKNNWFSRHSTQLNLTNHYVDTLSLSLQFKISLIDIPFFPLETFKFFYVQKIQDLLLLVVI